MNPVTGRFNQYASQVRDDFVHCVDFGCRIVTKVEGFDGASKFGTSLLTFYTNYITPFVKAYLDIDLGYVEGCGNLNKMLANVIEMNKFTNFAPRFYKWIKDDNSDRSTWKKAFQLTSLCLVTTFDIYNFGCIVSGVKKGGTVFKLMKNSAFVSACTFGILNDSDSIDALELKKNAASNHRQKWDDLAGRISNDSLKINSNENLAIYYGQKSANLQGLINNPPPGVDARLLTRWNEKKTKWEGKAAALNNAGLDAYKTFTTKLEKKKEIWEARRVHYINEIDSTSENRSCQGLKIVSLAIDITKIALTALSMTSIVVAGYVLPAVTVASVCFDLTNLYLGGRSMAKFHHREYTVGGHVDDVKRKLNIDMSKETPFQIYTYAEVM